MNMPDLPTAPPVATPMADPVMTPGNRSGVPVPPSVDASAVHPERIGEPGQYPFTRGIFPDGYQGRLWTIRQYSGFGTAEESNERYKFLLAQGQTGLSVALDLPTQCGYDPTHAMARPEIGKVGVSLSNLSEAEILFKDLDLSKISTSFTIIHRFITTLRRFYWRLLTSFFCWLLNFTSF